MALINCPECGKTDVSSNATQCPKCGYNIREHFENIERLAREQEQKQAEEKAKARELERYEQGKAQHQIAINDEINKINLERDREIKELKSKSRPEMPSFLKFAFDLEKKGCLTIILLAVMLLLLIGAFVSTGAGTKAICVVIMFIILISLISMVVNAYIDEKDEIEYILNNFDSYIAEKVKPINEEYDKKIVNAKNREYIHKCSDEYIKNSTPTVIPDKSKNYYEKVATCEICGHNQYATTERCIMCEGVLVKADDETTKQMRDEFVRLKDEAIVRNALKSLNNANANTNVPKCPTCGSTNISKISTLNRGVSVYAVGLASDKIGKQFKCGKCGYMW